MFQQGVSWKRYLAAHLFPYSRFVDRTTWNAKWYRTIREISCPEFNHRNDMYAYIQTELLKGSIDYIEFGVGDGESLQKWCNLNRHPNSRFYGFDTFKGLPEHWNTSWPKGAFDQGGSPPDIKDSRVKFEIGLFQDRLPKFLDSYHLANRLIIHNDADLYSSTLYTLTMMNRFISADTIVIFDEFWDALNEYRALSDYSEAYGKKFELIAATSRFGQAAVRLLPR
jgi:O-methyltransferase